MKISRRWLQQFLSPAELPNDDELAALLTGRGLEVDSMHALSTSGLIAGEIINIAAHPQIAKLRLCDVNVGGQSPLSIICGAPNVKVEQYVIVAPIGACVGDTVIKERVIRDVSSMGMICSAQEIGIGNDTDSIVVLDFTVTVGESLDDKLMLPDTIFDIRITPNRGDCLSHLGIAREIAAELGKQTCMPDIDYPVTTQETFSVTIDESAQAACPYYGCLLICDINAGAPAPWWLKTMLERCDYRSINTAADVANYIMLAIGQPLHAFDADKIHHGIRVRMAQDQESVTLLNQQQIICQSDTVVIADHSQAIAIGGVMGGLESSVSDNTRRVLLEAAFFAPAAIRGKSQRHQLTSEAAYRFERGVSPTLPPVALALGGKLLLAICGGNAGPFYSAGNPPQPTAAIHTSGEFIRDFIGIEDIDDSYIADSLTTLGIQVRADNNGITAQPPNWRFDIEQPADIAEEVIRSWGYHRLPETPPPGGVYVSPLSPQPLTAAKVRRHLVNLGFTEIITYAFVPPEWEQKINSNNCAIKLKNPINANMSVMRTTLINGLIDRAIFNINNQQERLRLFEIGRCFNATDTSSHWRQAQPLLVAGIISGSIAPPQWNETARDTDFYDLKGWLAHLLHPAGDVDFSPQASPPDFLHPQQSAHVNISFNGSVHAIGVAGALHPTLADHFGFRHPPLVFELHLETLIPIRRLPQAVAISRFPVVRRDLSVSATNDAQSVLTVARRAIAHFSDTRQCDITLFDVYDSDNIKGKFYGIRLTMQGINDNLTDDAINAAVDAVINALAESGISIRQ